MPEDEREQDVPESAVEQNTSEKEANLESRKEHPKPSPEKSEDDIFIEKIQKQKILLQKAIGKIRILVDSIKKVELDETTTFDIPPAETPGSLVNAFRKKMSDALTTREVMLKTAKDLSQEIKSIYIDTSEDQQKLNRRLGAAMEALTLAMQNYKTALQMKNASETLHQRYFEQKFQEAGFNSEEELDQATAHADEQYLRGSKWDRISRLKKQYAGLGRIINRKSIALIRTEIERSRIEWRRLSDLRAVKYSHPDFELPHFYEYDLKKEQVGIAGEIIQELANKIIAHYDSLLEKQPAPEGNKINEFDEETVRRINDRYVEETVLPKVETYVEAELSADREGFQAKLQEAREILQQSFALDMNTPYNFGLSSEEARKEEEHRNEVQALFQRLKQLDLPYSIERAFEWEMRGGQNQIRNDCYKNYLEFTNNFAARIKENTIKETYENVLADLKGAIHAGPYEISGIEYKLPNTPRVQDIKIGKDKIGDFIKNLDVNRWIVFREEMETLDKEQIDRADKFLGRQVLKQLLVTKEHTDESVGLGYKLFGFRDMELAPYKILNSYREPGYSGERPFVSIHSSSDHTELFRFISSLKEEDIQALEKFNIPGLMEIIALIKSNPKDFTRWSFYDEKTQISSPNPVYKEIEENLIKMGSFYLAKRENIQFVVSLYKSLSVDLGDGYKLLAEVLQDTGHPAILEYIEWQSVARQDGRAAGILLENFDQLHPNIQNWTRADLAHKLIGGRDMTLSERGIENLSKLLDITPDELNQLLNFIGETSKIYEMGWGRNYGEKYFEDYLKLSRDPKNLELIRRLAAFGYEFSIQHASIFPELLTNRENIISSIAEIRKIFPEFRYHLPYDFVYNPVKKESEPVYNVDPYEVFAQQMNTEEFLGHLFRLQREGENIRREFYDSFMRSLRNRDPLLEKLPHGQPIPEASYTQFHSAMTKLVTELFSDRGKLFSYAEYYTNPHLLKFLARQPERAEEIMHLPELAPGLFTLLDQGGSLYKNRDNIIRDIFENGDAVRRAREIATIFNTKVPYWRQLHLFTRTRIGEQLRGAGTGYPITEVSGVTLVHLVERHKKIKTANPNQITRLEGLIKNKDTLNQLLEGKISAVPFFDIAGVYKEIIYRDYLKRTIETSRSETLKHDADQRNRNLAIEPFLPQTGMYIHGSAIDHMDSFLLNGNLPKESLGEAAATDSYPFQVDFTHLLKDFIEKQKSAGEVFTNSISGGYGQGGQLGQHGQLWYVYDRNSGSWEKDKIHATHTEAHALILGGIPSTEITAIVLRQPDVTLERVKKSVIENGFYVPIYDLGGKLLLSPEEYDRVVKDYNLRVPVEIWDYSLKSGEQLGSNPGGEFTVPTREGPVKFYVKFGRGETDHLWSEQLADNMYRELGIPVPETQIVKVEGSYGHASRLMTGSQPNTEDFSRLLKDGFLADCLLANWDIAAKTDNVLRSQSDGLLYRLDNGGALLFRAQGERKPTFGAIVTELESMKNAYGEISREDLEAQLANLREKFTDEVIDRLVDSVRLKTADRDELKKTLKERRDYILANYEVSRREMSIPQKGKEVADTLSEENISDEKISALIKEWSGLIGEEGYQHNKILLGGHLKEAIRTVRQLPEYQSLSETEKTLALISTIFHDIGKPTGRADSEVVREFDHEIPSAQIAAEYMKEWGFGNNEINAVVKVITYDGIVSDIAREKVRDPKKNLTPEQLRGLLGDPSVIKILRAVNRADVIATVGENAFSNISAKYNQYFDQLLS